MARKMEAQCSVQSFQAAAGGPIKMHGEGSVISLDAIGYGGPPVFTHGRWASSPSSPCRRVIGQLLLPAPRPRQLIGVRSRGPDRAARKHYRGIQGVVVLLLLVVVVVVVGGQTGLCYIGLQQGRLSRGYTGKLLNGTWWDL
ncbi:hypothetical protein CRUP_020245 [Coryphaenoides rupestris]|nr:hypothetical protein CRUP_020245 [Coryphaenoides rupestris]